MGHQPRVLDDIADSEAQLDRVDGCVTSFPLTVMVPDVGSIIRLIIRSAVVLPLPEEPTKTVSLPSGISRFSSIDSGGPVREYLADVVESDQPAAYCPTGWSKPLSRTQFRAAWSGSMPALPDTAALSSARPDVVSFADTASSTSLRRSDFFCEFTSGTIFPARKLCSGSSSATRWFCGMAGDVLKMLAAVDPALHQRRAPSPRLLRR